MRLAFAIGGVIDYGFSDAFSLQSGLMFSSKGYSSDLDKAAEKPDGKQLILNYLRIPITIAYKIKGFQIYAGTYVAFGIGGKLKWDYTYTINGVEETDKDDMKIKHKMGEVKEGDLGDDEGAFSGLDYGLSFRPGLSNQINTNQCRVFFRIRKYQYGENFED